MNARLNGILCCLAMSGLLLAGCAGTPAIDSSHPASGSAPLPANFGSLPQATLSGASRDELKMLAMGLARSKGWTVSDAGPDRIVAKRPLDPSLVSALERVSPGSTAIPGSTLEVTSYFVQQGGGTNVATKAELIPPAVGGRPSAPIDYTDDYRDALEHSLDSLRSDWSRNRGRVARATPPADGWADPWAGTPYARPEKPKTEATEPAGTDIADAPSDSAPDMANTPPSYTPEPSTTPAYDERPAPETDYSARAARPSSPDIAEAPIPDRSASLSSDYSRPMPEPRRRPPSAAPVVDATQVLSTGYRSSPTDSGDRLSPRDNMMALPESRTPATSRANWAASAEQYARQHGCQVSAGGAQLIESRRDGEVHKVPCDGSDSFLVKCQNGTCQGLL